MSEINRAIGERPALEWVKIDRIDVDSNYQRDIKPQLVDKILRRFAWAKFGAIVLARHPDGRFTVVEGQPPLEGGQPSSRHRGGAGRHRPITTT